MVSDFGSVLRELRENRGLSVNQLAIYSGVSSGLISKIENNKRGTPKPGTIKKLAKGLKMEYEELMIKAGHVSGTEKLQAAWSSRQPTKQDQLDSIDRYIKDAGEKLGDNVGAERLKLVREIMEHIIDLPEEDQRRISDFAARLRK